MRTTLKQLTHRVLILAVGICILTAACGSDSKKTATAKPSAASSSAAESAYCDTAREWAVHELAPADESDPSAFRAYWAEYTAFNHRARDLAPAELADEWALSATAIDTVLTPVLEKYDFDMERLGTEGTDAEKSLGEPPPEVQAAQGAIHGYESRVCAAGQPPAADVDFSGEKKATAYCEAVATDEEMFGGVLSGGARPEDMRKLVTSKEYRAVIDKEHDSAPKVIKDDSDALYEFFHDEQIPLVAKYGYDFPKLLLEGSQAERETLQATAPEIRDHYARVAAYEEQVCGLE